MNRAPRPSLNALKAFEATARLRSFTAAADELSVTHGAISRHIRTLEDTLGVQLLSRNAHGTDATPQGARLAEGLSSAFNLIQASIEQLKPGPLTVSCSESVMMYWLLPRVMRFQRQHAEIDMRFNMSNGAVDFARDNTAIAIRVSTLEPPKDAVVHDVVEEWVGPVCTADYAHSQRLRKTQDIERCRLLISRTRPHAWAEWLRASGQSVTDLPIADSFEHFYLLIQAARCGLGIANVPRMLVQDDIASGALIAPFGFVRGPKNIVLWVGKSRSETREVRVLKEWLVAELMQSEKTGMTTKRMGPAAV